MNPYTNVFPLAIVLAVSLFKEALEDRKRRGKDLEVGLYLQVEQSPDLRARHNGSKVTKW